MLFMATYCTKHTSTPTSESTEIEVIEVLAQFQSFHPDAAKTFIILFAAALAKDTQVLKEAITKWLSFCNTPESIKQCDFLLQYAGGAK
jgi:hypothetical protein